MSKELSQAQKEFFAGEGYDPQKVEELTAEHYKSQGQKWAEAYDKADEKTQDAMLLDLTFQGKRIVHPDELLGSKPTDERTEALKRYRQSNSSPSKFYDAVKRHGTYQIPQNENYRDSGVIHNEFGVPEEYKREEPAITPLYRVNRTNGRLEVSEFVKNE